jgi:hypothetical protein
VGLRFLQEGGDAFLRIHRRIFLECHLMGSSVSAASNESGSISARRGARFI